MPSILLTANSINYGHTYYANNIEEYQGTTFIIIAVENETVTTMFVKHMHHNIENSIDYKGKNTAKFIHKSLRLLSQINASERTNCPSTVTDRCTVLLTCSTRRCSCCSITTCASLGHDLHLLQQFFLLLHKADKYLHINYATALR
jgi:hypothetical protein